VYIDVNVVVDMEVTVVGVVNVVDAVNVDELVKVVVLAGMTPVMTKRVAKAPATSSTAVSAMMALR